MTNSQRLATVRARFLRWLAAAEHCGTAAEQSEGASHDLESAILRESILIRDEFYCGRRFHSNTHNAVWFIEEDELKVYRNSGELECVLSSDEIDSGSDKMAPDADSPSVIKMQIPVERDLDSDDELRRAA